MKILIGLLFYQEHIIFTFSLNTLGERAMHVFLGERAMQIMC